MSETQNREVDYALRRVDRELWRRVKERAAGEGRSLRFILIAFLKVYAEHGFEVVEAFNRARGLR